MWGLVAMLIGVLAVSALFVAFCLLYSPLDFINNLKHLFGPRWVDTREVRFYRSCFVLLCFLGGAAVLSPLSAPIAFVLLAGSAPILTKARL